MQEHGPTVRPPQPGSLNSALSRNIEALRRREEAEAERATIHQRMAVAITNFAGSFWFVYLHIAWIGFWVVANLGWLPAVAPWDPSFVILAMVASVEAIFLSTFVLITQNRMAEATARRDSLDLQTSLLTEHELTKLMNLSSAIAERLGIRPAEEIEELKRDVAPEAVLDALEDAEH